LIKKGVSADRLIQAAKNYAVDCKAESRNDFFYKASNFLGKAEYYKAYLPDNWVPVKLRGVGSNGITDNRDGTGRFGSATVNEDSGNIPKGFWANG